jgi:hypothetical protein
VNETAPETALKATETGARVLAKAIARAQLVRWGYDATLDEAQQRQFVSERSEDLNLHADLSVALGALRDAGWVDPGEARVIIEQRDRAWRKQAGAEKDRDATARRSARTRTCGSRAAHVTPLHFSRDSTGWTAGLCLGRRTLFVYRHR